MKCPNCYRVLADIATTCRCGWSKGGDGKEFIQCAYETCGESAMVKVKTATGWAKFCMHHYDAHYRDQGKRAMAEHGLTRWADESPEDHRKRVFEYWKLLSRKTVKTFKDAA